MGCPCETQLYAPSQAQASHVFGLIQADVRRLEARYSRYIEGNLLFDINQAALRGGFITMDAETSALMDYAHTCFEQSHGLFDVTSGLLRKVWTKGRTDLPTKAELAPVLERIGWNKVERNQDALQFLSGMEIDLGGIVKEYAADRAGTICMQAGIAHAIINLGGDIRAVGPHPDGAPWRIGIQHPRKKGEAMRQIPLIQGAIATSGDYERCWLIGGQRYGHILNPMTGYPVTHLASVTVISALCTVAGSASTIAMLKEHQGVTWLSSLGVSYLSVDTQGQIESNITL